MPATISVPYFLVSSQAKTNKTCPMSPMSRGMTWQQNYVDAQHTFPTLIIDKMQVSNSKSSRPNFPPITRQVQANQLTLISPETITKP